MNKIKTTKREMRDNYFIIGVGYCKAQWLLNYENPIAYSVGAYGWACDYYEVDGVVISTGYSPLNSKNALASYEMIKSYDDKASLILENGGNHEQKKNALKMLLIEFVREAKRNSIKEHNAKIMKEAGL
jgi:hypothetical protein